ncbi:MAG TPA: hypothetical protein VG867_05455 [Rhizomicrobium sp.]|nr:hypothetical protein [Rhizomicrobium sp.]
MSDTIEPLLLDLVAWVAKEPRSYFETMDAWRTSCPRLPVWEEANARGLITRTRDAEGRPIVAVTAFGRSFLQSPR